MTPSQITVQPGTESRPAAKVAVRALFVLSAVLFLTVPARTEAQVTNGLGLWLKLNTDLVDSSTNGNNGTITSGLSYVTGQNGMAYNAAGIGVYGMTFVVSNSPTIIPSNAITLSTWVDITYSPGPLFGCSGYSFYGNTGANFNTPSSFTLATSGGSLSLSTTNIFGRYGWHLFTATWDSAGDGKLRVYFDGILDSVSSSSVSGTINSRGDLTVGLQPGVPLWNNGGASIDDFRIYTRSLSDSEIYSVFTNGTVTGTIGSPQGFTNSLPAYLPPPSSNVVYAASGSYVDVSNAVAAATAGYTVVIPAGTNIWTHTLNFSGITLWGAGVSNTVIVDETVVGSGGQPMVGLFTTANNLTRITQIQFIHGVTNDIGAGAPYGWIGFIYVGGTSPLFRIDHCFFNQLSDKNIAVHGQNGLVDHCTFYANINQIVIQIHGSDYNGDASWATPSYWGTTNAGVYVEDCYFLNGATDTDTGGRLVFRHNTADSYPSYSGFFLSNHGTEIGGGRWRGYRLTEVYENTLFYHPLTAGNYVYVAVDLRGGSALIFSNTFINYGRTAAMEDTRLTDNNPDGGPWLGATGISGWDTNSALLLSGTASATSNLLYVAGATWTDNEWMGCTVWNTNNRGQNISLSGYNNGNIGLVTGNTSNTMTFAGSRVAGLQIHFTVGDTFVVHRVLAGIDFTGRGQGDLLVDQSSWPTPVWLNQELDPCYFWGNIVFQNQGGVEVQTWGDVGTEYPGAIVENRDFYNTPKPGYTPLVYPHPLVTGTNAPAPPPSYTLTVVNGTGSGTYYPNSIVSISANTISSKIFENWSGFHVVNTNSASTTVIMPAANVTVTPNYAPLPPTQLKPMVRP